MNGMIPLTTTTIIVQLSSSTAHTTPVCLFLDGINIRNQPSVNQKLESSLEREPICKVHSFRNGQLKPRGPTLEFNFPAKPTNKGCMAMAKIAAQITIGKKGARMWILMETRRRTRRMRMVSSIAGWVSLSTWFIEIDLGAQRDEKEVL